MNANHVISFSTCRSGSAEQMNQDLVWRRHGDMPRPLAGLALPDHSTKQSSATPTNQIIEVAVHQQKCIVSVSMHMHNERDQRSWHGGRVKWLAVFLQYWLHGCF